MSSWRRLAPGLAIAATAVFLLRRALFLGETLFWRDVNMVWLPQVEVFVRTVAGGSLPLWDAWTGFGRPLLADPRAEVFYPLTWLNLLLPPARFYTLFTLLHLVLGGLGAYRLAGSLAAGRAAAAVGGIAFAASGPLPSLALTWHHMAGAAWMPWVLHASLRAARGERGGERALAVVLALQVFAGSPDYSALTLVAVGPLLLAAARPSLLAALRRTATGVVLGLLLAAPQWLPAALWAAQAQRGALPRESALVWSLHPWQLAEVAVPTRFWDLPLTTEAQAQVLGGREPWLHSIHFGAGLLALATVALAQRRRAPWALALIAALALLAALGPHTPALGLALDLVPPLAALRFPVKAMALFGLAICTLAALGLDRLAREPTAGRPLAAAGLGLGLALLAAALASGTWAGLLADPAAVALVREAILPSGAIALAAAALAAASLAPARRAAWVAAFALLPPLYVQRHLLVTTPADLLTRRPEALRLLELGQAGRLYTQDQVVMPSPLAVADADSRLALRGTLSGHSRLATAAIGLHLALNPPTAARWGVAGSFDRDILHFEPPFLVRLNDLLREREGDPAATARLLALGAVGSVASLTPGLWAAGLEPRARLATPFTRPLTLWRVPASLPRVYAVTGVYPLAADASPAALLDPAFDPARAVALPLPARAAAGSARVESFAVRPDVLRATVVADGPAYLVLVDAWAPGWSARVDGAPAPVLRANAAFRAVPVPAGRHQVTLRYWPPGLTPGLALATLGLAALLLAARRGWL